MKTPPTPEYASEQLMLALSCAKGIEALIQLASELLDNPIAVGDTSLTVHYTSGDMPPQVPMAHPGMISPSFFTDAQFIQYNEEAYYSDTPIVTGPQYGDYQTVLTRLKIHGQAAGYMSVLLSRHPLRENDMELIYLIRCAVEVELGKNSSILSRPPKSSEYALLQLLDGHPAKAAASGYPTNADANITLGIEKNALLYVIVFKMPGYSRANAPGLAVRRELSRMCGLCVSVLYDGHIVILRQGLLSRQPELVPPYKTMTAFLKKYGIVCGISTYFTQVTDVRTYYDQALAALSDGAAARVPGVYRYEQTAAAHFFKNHPNKGQLRLYCHPGIFKLYDYDLKNGTHYIQVLKAYVENEKNAVLTAKSVHLSKASVYRILERIRVITGQSLDPPQILFHLYFSIKLLEYDA